MRPTNWESRSKGRLPAWERTCNLRRPGLTGKGWEVLATGKTAAQGPNKLNIRDLSTGADVFTLVPGGLLGINDTNPGTVLQVTDKNVPCCAVGTVLAADAFKTSTALFGDVTGTSGLSEGVLGQIFSSTTGSAAVVGNPKGLPLRPPPFQDSIVAAADLPPAW
jgi:hypothetical protein